MAAPSILAFAGSTREGSVNKKLIRVAVSAAKASGAEVTLIDLRDFPMPLYDGDLEAKEGLPAAAQKFKALMIAHQGFLVASPEYNSSIPGGMKNALDWASRQAAGEAPLAAFTGKAAAIMSASPGGLGGLRGLVHLRAMLSNIQVLVIPEQVAVPRAHEAFNSDGSLKDPKQQSAVEGVAQALAALLQKLHA